MSPIPITSTNFEQVDPGTHAARLIRVIDLGTQESTFNGQTTKTRKVLFTFELVHEHMSDGRPFAASRTYTASLHEKSALRRDVEAWFGKTISRDAEQTFDLHSLLGRAAQVTVAETETGGRKVTALAGVARGMTVPPAENAEMYFSLDPREFSEDALAQVPEFWQEKIKASPEYKLIADAQDYFRSQQAPEPVEDDNYSAPWPDSPA